MSKPFLRFLAVSFFALVVSTGRGDVVTLKGGEKLEGRITEETAMEYASNPHDLKLMLAAGGRRASGIEQLDAAMTH